jgi:hypothetical protein
MDWIEEVITCLLASLICSCCVSGVRRAMLYDLIEMVLGGSMRCVITILTKWFSSTRLETRTKESNIYASIWVENPDA